MKSDAELLRRYADTSSDEDFTEFVGRHVGLVYHAALRQLNGDVHRAEDVTQLVFTDLARKAGSVCRHPAIASWLHKSTRYAAANARRAEWSRQKYELEAETMNELQRENSSPAEWERLQPMIDDALHELNDRDREAVLLRFFEGRTFAEIGAALALGENGARMRVARSLDKLHAQLARRGITSTTAALGAVLANQVAMGAPAGLAASVAVSALSGVAAGAAGAGAGVTLWSFIMTTKGTAVLSVVGALMFATAAYQTTQARAAMASLADAGRVHAAMRARLDDLETRTQAAEQARATRASTSASVGVSKSLVAVSSAAAEKAKQEQALQQFLNNDPELRKLRLEAAQAAFKSDFAHFLRSLGFTPDQIEQAAELAAQSVETENSSRTAGPDTTDAGVDLEKFRAMFGDTAAERFTRHLKRRDAASLVDGLWSSLFRTEDRFTPQQTDQLIEIILTAKTGVISAATNTPGISVDRALVDWAQVLREAGPILSPVQMHHLHALAALGRVEAQLAAAAPTK